MSLFHPNKETGELMARSEPEPLPGVDRAPASGRASPRLWALSFRCAVLALCLLPVVLDAKAQEAPDTMAGTLLADIDANGPLAGRLTLHRVAQGPCGWENPPADKRVQCRGTYTEDTPSSYMIWQLRDPFAVATQESTLDYAPMDITATKDEDYTASSGSLTIPLGGYKSERAYVYFIDDSTDEHDETMAFKITVVKGNIGAPDFLAFQIQDNDPEPSLSISDASAAEDGGPLSFDVSLDAASGKEVTVEFTTADGTASSPGDYASASSSVTFAAGDIEATIMIDLVDDGVAELDEDMTVTLSNAANATIGTARAIGTILDTSGVPSVSVSDARGAEDTVGNLAFAVELSEQGTSEITVAYATSDGTATAGTDYTDTSGTATFPIGTTALTINVPVQPDTVIEPDEDLVLTLTSPVNVLIVDGTATGTIENDDAVLPELAIANGEASEGADSLPLVVSVSGERGNRSLSVDYATSDGTAMAGDDYTQSSSTLTFAAGVSTATIMVPLL